MPSSTEQTMLAAQYNKVGEDLGLTETITDISNTQNTNLVEVNRIAIPQVGDSEVLIKTKCASLCHSDLVRDENCP